MVLLGGPVQAARRGRIESQTRTSIPQGSNGRTEKRTGSVRILKKGDADGKSSFPEPSRAAESLLSTFPQAVLGAKFSQFKERGAKKKWGKLAPSPSTSTPARELCALGCNVARAKVKNRF
jgi:hypothetical protein